VSNTIFQRPSDSRRQIELLAVPNTAPFEEFVARL